MVKRFREPVDVVTDGASLDPAHPAPRSFRWRRRTYVVVSVLGHWREDAGYWTARGLEVPQRDLWRVEARRTGGPSAGVFELVRETDDWRLQRLWD
jgi:hypothetical protein